MALSPSGILQNLSTPPSPLFSSVGSSLTTIRAFSLILSRVFQTHLQVQTGRFPPGSDRSSCAGEQFDGPFDPHYFRRTVPDPFSEVTPSKWENENASSPPNQPCRARSGFTDRFLSSHPIEDTSNILSAPNQRSRTLQGLERLCRPPSVPAAFQYPFLQVPVSSTESGWPHLKPVR